MTSRYVSIVSPAFMALKPVKGVGKKMPPSTTTSPALTRRVASPLATTVIVRGMWPTGTSSGSSWILSSWYFTNLHVRVCICTRPRVWGAGCVWGGGLEPATPHAECDCTDSAAVRTWFISHCGDMQRGNGMKVRPTISW